jgi:hypothetical protein
MDVVGFRTVVVVTRVVLMSQEKLMRLTLSRRIERRTNAEDRSCTMNSVVGYSQHFVRY